MRHLVGTNINNFDVGVFTSCKNSTDLCILSLQELLHTHSFYFINWERVDMYFDSFLLLDCIPFLLKFLHHLFPNKHVVSIALFDLGLRFLLKLEESVGLLNHRGLLDQKPKVCVSDSSFVHAPVLLYHSYCFYGTLVTLEHKRRNPNTSCNFVFIIDAVKEFIVCWLVYKIDFSTVAKTCYFTSVNIGHLHTWTLKELFNQHKNIWYLAPLL